VYYAPADCLNSDIYHQPTYYTYDGRNLPLTAEDALGNTVRYEYDEAGNLVRVTDQDDFVTGFAYDLNSQLTNIRYDDNRQVAFTYDPRGYMTGFTDWLGDNSFDLDPLGASPGSPTLPAGCRNTPGTPPGKNKAKPTPTAAGYLMSTTSLIGLPGSPTPSAAPPLTNTTRRVNW